MERLPVTAARILEQRSHIVPGALRICEHFFEVPRDYSSPKAGTLRLFARSAHKHTVPVEAPKDSDTNQTPYLLYLQGGPGSECRAPQSYPFTRSFLDKGYALFFLDQRGTGLSSPITAATLSQQGDAEAQANHLSLFRADNIVRDAEAIRLAITDGWPEPKRRWSLIGQSFGGFCSITYLSLFPKSVREAFIAGGLPPIGEQNPDNVYERLIKRIIQRNRAYYGKYPEDVERVKTVVRHLNGDSIGAPNPTKLPSGGLLTPSRLLSMGMGLGFHGGIDALHDTIIRISSDLDLFGFITRPTAMTLESSGGHFDANPLYCALHEPIYCQGRHASNWSAKRVIQTYPEFDIDRTLSTPDQPLLFTGEMIFPWMLDTYPELMAMAQPAQMIAQKDEWPSLYDIDELKRNEVPVYAAVYADDLYVDCDLALDAAKIIKNCQYYLTNRIYHDGLRSRTDNVIETLWKLRTDTID